MLILCAAGLAAARIEKAEDLNPAAPTRVKPNGKMQQQTRRFPQKQAIRPTLWYNFFSKWRCCHEKLCHESETDSRKAILDKDLTGPGDPGPYKY